MAEGEYIFNLCRRRSFIQDSPTPVLASSSAGELNSVTSAILAINVKEEQVPLLQLINQAKRNVDKSSLVSNIQSGNKKLAVNMIYDTYGIFG